jgi:diacylglycerol kinase (ATP)
VNAVSGIGVVVNPRAGGNRRAGGRAARLGDVVGRYGWVRETESLERLAEVAAESRRQSVDLVAVCGGDGTVARTLSALVREYGGEPLPDILPLRAGTMNTIARAMGCPAWRPERMLAQVVAGYRNGGALDSTQHQLLRVNGADYGFMVGVGVPVGFLRVYYARPWQGAGVAARVLAELGASALVGGRRAAELFRPIRVRLLCDGEAARFERLTVIYASSIEDIGLGFRPTYRARERRGFFHVFAGSLGARGLLFCLPRIWLGAPTRSRRVHDALVRRLVIEFREPNFYMIDGDVMEPVQRLVVEEGPIVRVIRRQAE